MGLADRDYARKRKVQWDASRDAMQGDGTAHSRPSVPPWWGGPVMLVMAIVGIVGAGLWWQQNSGLPVPDSAAPPAPPVHETPTDPVPPVESDNPVLVGRVTRVLDGDTIEVALSSGPVRVRFGSIDAPEKNQPWGREARAALARKLGDREVELDVVSQDQYDRLVALVGVDGENVNAWLVQQGHAWAYRQYMKDRMFCAWEAEARSARRGLWALPAAQRHAPWEFRAVQRGRGDGFTDYSNETVAQCMAAMQGKRPASVAGGAAATSASSSSSSSGASSQAGCTIKGNISGSGKIYHLPGRDSYARTKIDEAKGERWFCNEEEARAAGWRAPKR